MPIPNKVNDLTNDFSIDFWFQSLILFIKKILFSLA
jgi:hypothetical protein